MPFHKLLPFAFLSIYLFLRRLVSSLLRTLYNVLSPSRLPIVHSLVWGCDTIGTFTSVAHQDSIPTCGRSSLFLSCFSCLSFYLSVSLFLSFSLSLSLSLSSLYYNLTPLSVSFNRRTGSDHRKLRVAIRSSSITLG